MGSLAIYGAIFNTISAICAERCFRVRWKLLHGENASSIRSIRGSLFFAQKFLKRLNDLV